jgi:hypothetical protein
MLIVAEDPVGAARIQDGVLGAPLTDGAEFVSHA